MSYFEGAEEARPDLWIMHHAACRPDDVVVVDEGSGERLSWAGLEAMMRDVGAELEGSEPGQCVALDMPGGGRFLAALGACAARGLVCAPLHRRWDEPARAEALDVLGAVAYMTSQGVVWLEGARPMPLIDDEPPALVLFTSGTSGAPRAVPLTRQNLCAVWDAFERDLGLRADHVLAAIAPWYHVAGLNTMTLPLLRLGGTLVCFDGFDVDALARATREHGVDAAFMVPTMWEALRRSAHFERGVFDGFEVALSGGARAAVGMLEAWSARHVRMLIGYGMTEAAPTVTLATPEQWRADSLSVGAPHASVEVRLCEVDGPGEPARIGVRGPNVAHGYLVRGGFDREAWTPDGFFVTRDLGEWGASPGTLRFLGRADDVIVCGGEKISALEVEAALEDLESDGDVVVVGMPDAYWGEVVTAVWQSGSGGLAYNVEEVRAMLEGKLARYKMPRACVEVERWPLGATGKIDRAQLTRELLTRWDASRER